MIDKSKYIELLKKYLDGNSTIKENDELFMLTSSEEIHDILSEEMDAELIDEALTGADLSPQVAEEILRNILSYEKHSARIIPLFPGSKKIVRWLVAAVIVGVAITGTYYFGVGEHSSDSVKFETLIPRNENQTTNHSLIPLVLKLEDGSEVVLKPNSTLHYPLHFATANREVYLTGEAFFKISKNPNRPFLVYYDNIVTRVLGTSFTIKTNSKTNQVEVVVCTGKVQVFENRKLIKIDFSSKSVIVTPNQKAIYDGELKSFEITLADSLQEVAIVDNNGSTVVKHQENLVFTKATTIKDVFAQLEKLYGIEIVVDNENIYNCVFKGDLSKQDVYNKLSIICLAIEASYEIKGTRILVSGKGCN